MPPPLPAGRVAADRAGDDRQVAATVRNAAAKLIAVPLLPLIVQAVTVKFSKLRIAPPP